VRGSENGGKAVTGRRTNYPLPVGSTFCGIWNYLAEDSSLRVADKVLADIESAILKLTKTPQLGHRRPDLTDRDLRSFECIPT